MGTPDRHPRLAGRRLLLAFLLAGVTCACTGPLKLGAPAQLPQHFYETAPEPPGGAVPLSDAQLAQWWMRMPQRRKGGPGSSSLAASQSSQQQYPTNSTSLRPKHCLSC